MSGSSRERNETYTDNYHEVLCPYCNESNDPWRIHRSARGRCLRVGLRRLRKNIQRASAHFDKRNSGGAAMIPKTQSVCKHCGEPRTSYIHAPDLSDRAHVFEPVSEPASTGEPPPDRYDELQRAGCLVGCYWNYLDSPNQFIEHVEGCPNKIPAARPSEPSAPTVEPIIHARTKVSEGEHLSAPRKSAIEIAGERDLRVITEPIDWEAVENDAAPQTSAEQIEEKLFLYNKEGFEKMPAPQPVSGDAPGDFTEAELVAIERSSFDGSQLWRLARQLRERTAEREAYDSQRKYLLKKLAVAGTQPTPEERELLLAQFFPQGTAPAQGTPEPPKVEEAISQLLAITAKVARGVYMPDIDNCRNIREARAVIERGDALRVGLLHELNKVLEQLKSSRPYFPPASQTPPNKVTQQELDEMRINDRPPDLDWDKVHSLLEPWQEVWNGDKNRYAVQYPMWMVNAAAELFAHDICDVWSWNDYVAAATVIISRHLAATPASTARTDGLSLHKLCHLLNEESKNVMGTHYEQWASGLQRAITLIETGIEGGYVAAKEIASPAAPGSVPQAEPPKEEKL